MNKHEVLIVGGGPVGLTLAIDLGKRGIDCVLIEQKDAPQFLPKMERANARTMEMFRRIGLADPIRSDPQVRPARRLSDGRLRRVQPEGAAVVAAALPFRGRGAREWPRHQ